MSEKESEMKILIVGIGGVGGYFGGLLADKYVNNQNVDIYFLARGEHLDIIKSKGLTIVQDGKEKVVYPKLVTSNSQEIGKVDVVILATKTYDLEEACLQIEPCLTDQTIVLPLLNGVNNTENIRAIFPNNLILTGCVYIISRLTKPGVVTNSGNIQTLYFGTNNAVNERLKRLETILIEANIEATLSNNISTVTWEKYIFLSTLATATSYYNCPVGKLVESDLMKEKLEELIHEIVTLAHVKGIQLADDIESKTLKKIESLPKQVTSSMHSDYQKGKVNTEIEALTGYVVKEAEIKGVEVPLFRHFYNQLIKNES